MTSSKPLKELLADALPKHVPFTFYHFSTPPTKSPSLYSAPPQHKPERTYCESHFLAVSITPSSPTASSPPEELLILAIEVSIYTTKRLTTIFVSKADSTGYISLLGLPRPQAASPLKAVAGTFVSWLVRERQRPGKRLVVSLFARAQDQYLFPASVDNASKHVLDDRGLIRWWCRVLDPLVREYAVEEEQTPLRERLEESKSSAQTNGNSVSGDKGSGDSKEETTARGYLIIPGFDVHETMRYIPSPPSTSTLQPRWVSTHPLLLLTPHPVAPPRCLIPHFPDDPKSRFLDELDEELPDRGSDDMSQPGGTPSRSNGQWKSVKSLDQFWEMMAYRQECSSGRCVGFIWVVVTPPRPSIPEEDEEADAESLSQSQSQFQSQSQPQSQSQNPSTENFPSKPSPSTSSRKPRHRTTKKPPINTDFGPIPLRLPRIKSTTSSLSATSTSSSSNPNSNSSSLSTKLPPSQTPYFIWPSTSRGSLLFSPKDYARALEVLLQQNFATRAAAGRSSRRWKEEVGVLAGVEGWGFDVLGRKEGGGAGSGSGVGNGGVNVLSGKKKRKGGDGVVEAGTGDVKMLGEGLVRKKVKVEEDGNGMSTEAAANGVNMLGAGLVRKKPKA